MMCKGVSPSIVCIAYLIGCTVFNNNNVVLAEDDIFQLNATTITTNNNVDDSKQQGQTGHLFGDFNNEMTELISRQSTSSSSSSSPTLKGEQQSSRSTQRLRQHTLRKRHKKKGSRPGGRRPRPNRPPRPSRPNRPPSGSSVGVRPPPPQQNRPPPQTQQISVSSNTNNNSNIPSRTQCFSISTYEDIDTDIANIKNNIRYPQQRSHFLGGIVRLAAHDYMDYDRRDLQNPMGPDGCYDENHPSNAGLETIWCHSCPLKVLYDTKYSKLGISRADFWIASANAVIHQTSINNSLDLRGTFKWGRKDRDVCRGSGERLPQASGCDQVEDVFLRKMGLRWVDAVALLGAHTLGRGDKDFSGHEGTWVDNDYEAQVFDKTYYESFFTKTWRPRVLGGGKQDWTTGRGDSQMMLNTDMCLVFDIEETVDRQIPCCTRTNSYYPNGQSQCVDREASRRRCPMYKYDDRRRDATNAVREMLGGSLSSTNNSNFYTHFEQAWEKATTVGQSNLNNLVEKC